MINTLNYHRLGKHWLFLTLFASLALFVIPQIGCNLQSHPADQVMEERFRSNREDFNRLAQMFDEDNDVIRLTQKSVFLTEDSNRSLTEERLRDYRGLLEKLGLAGEMHRGAGGKLRLIASNRHMLLRESEKTYVYSRTPPLPLVESIDQVIGADRRDQRGVYKRIADDWYIYYESW